MVPLTYLWILIGCMALGVPIVFALAIAPISAFILAGQATFLQVLPQKILIGINQFPLLAIPLFILAGEIMNTGGITQRLVRLANALVGHFRGGLAQVNVVSSIFFAGLSGSAVADTSALGSMLIPAMEREGYTRRFAAAVTAASSVIGPIIPPSISLVVYAFLSGTSVARLFLAGIIPGLMVGFALMLFNRYLAIRRDFPREPRASLRSIVDHAVDGIAALVAPLIILSAIVTGYTTATEAGVLACAYSLLLGLIYRTITWAKLWQVLTDTMLITAVIMVIVGYSTVMGWLLAIEQIPQQLAESVLLVTESRYVFLGLLLIFLLLIGCVVEGVPAKLILVPMLLPIIDDFGVDRIHFGLIITMALLIGIATPPMGIGLYIMVEVGKVSFEKVTVAVLPFLIPLITVLILITYVPALTLWLPDLIMGPE